MDILPGRGVLLSISIPAYFDPTFLQLYFYACKIYIVHVWLVLAWQVGM